MPIPELIAPVPPQSAISPSSIASSCVIVFEELVLQRGFEIAESRPSWVRPAWSICDQMSPIEMPRSSVMRFEISAETSHSLAGGHVAGFDQDTVGSDSSSATHGSSMASVAGKKRAPTKQWANAAERAGKRTAAPARRRANTSDSEA